MKKIFAVVLLSLITVSAQAQIRPRPIPMPGPHRPIPRPMPGPRPIPGGSYCSVLMVDGYNRIVRQYTAQRDWRTGMCRDGLRQCNRDIRVMSGWGLHCVQR